MAEHVWTVLCGKVLSDDRLKLISLVDIIEKLTLGEEAKDALEDSFKTGKDGILFEIPLQLVSYWVRTDQSEDDVVAVRVSLISPSGKRMFSKQTHIELSGKQIGRRLVINIEGLGIVGSGMYWFEVERREPPKQSKSKERWRSVARVPIGIEFAPSQQSMRSD